MAAWIALFWTARHGMRVNAPAASVWGWSNKNAIPGVQAWVINPCDNKQDQVEQVTND